MEQQHATSPSRAPSKKVKVIIAVVCAVAVAAGIAVAVVASTVTANHHHGDPSIDLQTRAELHNMNKEIAIVQRRARQGGRREQHIRPQPCFSTLTNKSYPAAHIVGLGSKWQVTTEPTSGPYDDYESQYSGYQTKWVCNDTHNAFVDGGMNFTHSDQKLHVPVCGYYYVSSQVYFQADNTGTDVSYVRHSIKIERNCPNKDFIFTLTSHSSLSGKNSHTRVSTFIGDVVKMCSGGAISLVIPDNDNPCCPYTSNTYFSAHLVAKTAC